MTETTRLVQNLIDQALRGDIAARQELLEVHREHLRRMVAARLDRRLTSRVDPSDVVQETLADASKRMDDYLRERPLPFLGWLRQLAGERVIDAHRRHIASQRRSITRESRADAHPDDSSRALARRFLANDTSPSNRLSRRERCDQVMAALASLSARDREVLVMRYLEQLDAAQIAEALGITRGAVKARLLRALIHMRGRLEADG
ncbi:sigma-70 family RNA polymerase sigma factor [Tautonia plasticadhaerens]|uniref:ECF RNA polymerase sigma factor SigD n=1 Tax=Tautonia plasticadhaerens TaxID=2527974 RepID=A0A518HE94_9BACT|nr:sigma-70 family RNA polymerase sigma factor [Tautonia plasticadhaerens]QDV39163.1 ECF RNA polymerase sigma factor SigD [Tautonia plasticadhaerens]